MAHQGSPLVLLLDDDPSWLRVLGKLLERRGASVIALVSAKTLFERIANRTPDVMVIDFVLGEGKTGADAARTLREQLRGSCPPLLLVSSTLPEVSARDYLPFDAAYDKSTRSADLVSHILERGSVSVISRSEPTMRAACVGELGRSATNIESSGSSEG